MVAKTAILLYVPHSKAFLGQFWGLYHSVQWSEENRNTFHFVIVCLPQTQGYLPTENCTIFTRPSELAELPEFRQRFNNKPYRFINSLHPAYDEEVNQFVLSNFMYALRIDVDTFLTPTAHLLSVAPNSFMVGIGGYYNQDSGSRLKSFALKKRLDYDDSPRNIGSTWFGHVQDVQTQSRRTMEYVAALLAEDEVFIKQEGSWPQWYAGVILLYAGHVALLSSGLDIVAGPLDQGTSADSGLENYYSLHCWHSNDMFSKFYFADNRYDQMVATRDMWEGGSTKHYALWNALEGKKLSSSLVN